MSLALRKKLVQNNKGQSKEVLKRYRSTVIWQQIQLWHSTNLLYTHYEDTRTNFKKENDYILPTGILWYVWSPVMRIWTLIYTVRFIVCFYVCVLWGNSSFTAQLRTKQNKRTASKSNSTSFFFFVCFSFLSLLFAASPSLNS